MPISPRTLRPSSSFTPRSISGLALWLDASGGGDLFQNSDGSVPAINSGDPVGYWRDRSGNGRNATQATAGSRPTISATAQAGRRQLSIAATNSSLSTASLSLPAPFSVIAVVQRSVRDIATFLGSGDATNLQFGDGSALYSGAYYGASRIAGAVYGAAPIASGRSQVFSAVASSGTLPASLSMWADGLGGVATTITAGTAPNNVFGGPVQVGSSITTPWGGTICEVIAYNKALSTSERRRIERYLAAKWGITLAPQVSNADAQDWITRVYANGGTVSTSTASAVNTFCNAIDAAAIRDRFYRLNLFAGTGLNACLVPLYRGTSVSGTQYGGLADTNNGPFVSGDYVETGAGGGLTGNGTSKYLLTGLTTAALPQIATGHVSAYVATGMSGGAISGLVTSWPSGFGAGSIYGLEANRNGSGDVMAWWGEGFPGVNFTAAGNGNLMVTRTSSTALKLFDNGVQFGSTSTTSVTPATNSGSGFAVFCNYGTTPANYFGGRIAAYSIGNGMTDAQADAFHTAMQAFQTAMTRNI